ncbi:hypothetical protein F5050DRAFT_678583 [Lentinula boryana]|uniref:Uncharacterized protein n=1 Tax=Lentinula boryana TaxID=40481 RepID=A0ABQ8Q4I6_9AGAR|nr:hypothetical protein F5050DRAFT_678583 [Lentinula boryana]
MLMRLVLMCICLNESLTVPKPLVYKTSLRPVPDSLPVPHSALCWSKGLLLMLLGLASVRPLVAVPVSAPSRTIYATVWFKEVEKGRIITSDDQQHLQWATRKLMEKFTGKEHNTANIPFLSWENGPTEFAPEGFNFTFSIQEPPEGIRYHSGRVQLQLSSKGWRYRGSIWNEVNPAKEDKPVVENAWTILNPEVNIVRLHRLFVLTGAHILSSRSRASKRST